MQRQFTHDKSHELATSPSSPNVTCKMPSCLRIATNTGAVPPHPNVTCKMPSCLRIATNTGAVPPHHRTLDCKCLLPGLGARCTSGMPEVLCLFSYVWVLISVYIIFTKLVKIDSTNSVIIGTVPTAFTGIGMCFFVPGFFVDSPAYRTTL